MMMFGRGVQAQELPDINRNLRSLGMGGVQIVNVLPGDAVFYNPAALGKVEGLNFQLLNAGLGVNGLDVYNKIRDAGDLTDMNNFNNLVGTRVWLDGVGKASFTMPYFGVGYYTDYQQIMELHDPAFPKFKTTFQNDSAYVIGGAIPLGPSGYMGLNLKRMTRWGGNTLEIDASTVTNMDDVIALKDQFQNKGQGYGVDFAMMTELSAPLNPTLSVVWRDIGDTSFIKTAGTEAPPHIKQNLIFGAGVGLDLPGLDWALGFEARHLLDPDVNIGKKLHLGTEISLPLIDLRAGISQGYFSYGAGFNFLVFRFDAVSYSEELGTYPGQKADNRLMVGVGLDLSFDADFKFTDNNGKKRKLKQRR